MEGDRDQSHKNYMPYTNNLLKRCERGLPFFGITIGVFGVVVQYSIIYLKDWIENDKIAAAVVVSFFSYLLGVSKLVFLNNLYLYKAELYLSINFIQLILAPLTSLFIFK